MNAGTIIRKLRKQAGISQGDLAKACKLSQAYLSLVESNKREMHMSSLKRICEELEIPVPILLFLAMEESDVPEGKRDAYNTLFPAIKAMLVELFPKTKTDRKS